jgi:aminopeptidase N
VTVPDPWIVAASGVLRGTNQKDSKTTYIWAMDQPMASYLASINIDHYDLVKQPGPNGMTIRNYFPVDLPPEKRHDSQILPAAIEFLSSLFGPYPFDEYGIVVASNDGICAEDSSALEAQSMSIHCPSDFMTSEVVLVHELAHQWFGDSVSLKNWQDIWLKEGFASYAEWLWQTKNDPQQMLQVAKQERQNFNDSQLSVAAPSPQNLYTGESYTGGALVLEALRIEVGDETFFKILRTYAERYKYGVAGTTDFISVANEISGRDLTDFFKAWLFSPTMPQFQ